MNGFQKLKNPLHKGAFNIQTIKDVNQAQRPLIEHKAKLIFLRKLYENNFYAFAKQVCGLNLLERDTHANMVRVLQSLSPNKMLVCPRGSFKSSLAATAYPLWRLVKNPNLRIMIASELYTNSKNFIRQIRSIIESDGFRMLYGDWRGSSWGEGEIIVSSRTESKKEASITAAGIGTIKVGQHMDLVIFDDLNSQNNSDTPEKAQKVLDYNKYMISILDPGGEIVVTATRYSLNDLPEFVLKNEVGDEHAYF